MVIGLLMITAIFMADVAGVLPLSFIRHEIYANAYKRTEAGSWVRTRNFVVGDLMMVEGEVFTKYPWEGGERLPNVEVEIYFSAPYKTITTTKSEANGFFHAYYRFQSEDAGTKTVYAKVVAEGSTTLPIQVSVLSYEPPITDTLMITLVYMKYPPLREWSPFTATVRRTSDGAAVAGATVTFECGGYVDVLFTYASILTDASGITQNAIYLKKEGEFKVTVKASCLGFYGASETVTVGKPMEAPKPTAPSIYEVWDFLKEVWSEVWSFAKRIIGLTVIPDNVLYAGNTFHATFTLKNTKGVTVPDITYKDGTASYLYTAWMIVDSNGNIIHKGDVTEISSLAPSATTTAAVSWRIPETLKPNIYAATAVLIEIPYHYDSASSLWIKNTPTIVDKDAANFEVKEAPSPPTPNVWEAIAETWQNLINWLKSLFGWR